MPSFLIQEGNQYLDSWLYKYSSSEASMLDDDASTTQDPIVYKAPYHAGVMVDPHLDKIKAAGWTSIIKDNHSLRKLLQTYFLTEYTFFPAFQKDYFLQDMASSSKEHCSFLLVHAVLASACVGKTSLVTKPLNTKLLYPAWLLQYKSPVSVLEPRNSGLPVPR
jgi:hypothetical protein